MIPPPQLKDQGAKLRVSALIVDDEPHAIALLKRRLISHSQIQVIGEANSYEEGLIQIKNHNPTLLFLDVNLGRGKTGFDLLDQLNPKPVVVFTSGDPSNKDEAIRVGAIGFIHKPFFEDTVAEVVSKIVSHIK